MEWHALRLIAVRLTPPVKTTLEKALAYIEDDELIEVTPKSIRLRKALLDPTARKRPFWGQGKRLDAWRDSGQQRMFRKVARLFGSQSSSAFDPERTFRPLIIVAQFVPDWIPLCCVL